MAHAAARGFYAPYYSPDPDPDPRPDSPRVDSPKLIFPITDHRGEPATDPDRPGMDLRDPANISRSVEYDPDSNRYYLTERIGDQYYRNPTYLTFEEFQKYQAEQEEQAYWRRRLDALTMFNKRPELPTMYKEGIFDRIFGGQGINVRPQGNVDVTVGYNWQNIKNPMMMERNQKYGIFDFDMKMNINLLATVGDKLKLNISNNTQATFDYQNVQKLEYAGKEDEIIKKIEAGNVSFPLNSSLITGVQSLFGLKTQLQFGRLWVTGVVSQQKSKRQSLTVQGGAQTQTFAIKADDYEENRHFLLAQYFYQHYDKALENFPVIQSLVDINKVEVWVTNRTGATDGVRDLIALQDLGEKNPYRTAFISAGGPELPDNRSNTIYTQLLQNPQGRNQSNATSITQTLGLELGPDFERTTARKLNPSEYTFNSQLGYISLNTQLNPDDVLAVAYRYTYNGKVFQVGEFAEDLPPDSTNTKVMYMKLVKGTSARPTLPIWKLMMKNVYALGGGGISKEDFRLNILYQDPGGGEKRYLPETSIPNPGTPLLTLLNLDRLNIQGDPQPDGIFDYVEGITILPQQGKIIFPQLEPFGSDLKPALGGNPQLERRYLYQILYDSTKTIARQFQQSNRYVIRGSYKGSSSSEIFLGGFNIPPGSVSVNAGGQKLVENQDYQIDYGLGRVKILNQGILNSGIPVSIQYEDNATFGFQQQNFLGLRLDYYLNDKLTIGGTYMKLSERPFTEKTSFGEDPINNKVVGLDANYQSEAPGLTRLLDKLPIYSTTTPSFVTASVEGAGIFPGHSKLINALDPEGSVYIDDFEGARGQYDLKFPAQSWSIASTPVGATDKNGSPIFPEATLNNNLGYNFNRARLAWYMIEPTLIDAAGGVPEYVKKDPEQHYIRLVQAQDVFPQRSYATLQNSVSTLDLTFFPSDRGPYNFNVGGLTADGRLTNPEQRWGGIMRAIEYSDFEASNVEYIEFWVMDPFINKSGSGSLYLNLGDVSEDVLKDSRKFFENGIPSPKDTTKLDKSVWGYVPKFQQQITRAFDNDPAVRTIQDVGYDGLNNEEEARFFGGYLTQLNSNFGASSVAYQSAAADPSADDYKFYRDASFPNTTFIRDRYKFFNNPQGNSPVAAGTTGFAESATNIPESEDINRDNTLNENEDYFEYRIDFTPNMQVGQNFLVNKQVSNVKLPNGETAPETWYQFKIPIREYTNKVGNIADFRSIRFMRMYLTGFQDSVTFRFAELNLGRNQWRRYLFSLRNPGENIPEEDQKNTEFAVTSVSLEENSDRDPIPYVMPPGVNRQQTAVSNGQNIALNEQALSLQVCGLQDGDARAAFKEVNVDMRQFKSLRMFIHAESVVGQAPLQDGDIRAIVRLGSDFTNNYYEYQIPLQITNPGSRDPQVIWPERNRLDLVLEKLVEVKTQRNTQGLPSYVPYSVTDDKGNIITVVGNPNVGEAKTIMLGILNPKRKPGQAGDDGLPKCAEVWFNELRMTGLDESPAYAAAGKVDVTLADLGNVHLGGSMHTMGYGSIDQKLQQRMRDNYYQYDASTNLNLGKLLPKNWGVQLPVFIGHSKSISNPEYNPYDLDVRFKDQLDRAQNAQQRDSLREAAQDYTSITSINFSNVRFTGNPETTRKPRLWSLKNFDFSYAYNRQYKRDPFIEFDELTSHRIGLGYTYAVKTKTIEPFRRKIRNKSKWLALIRDFNFNPLPSNLTFRTELFRVMDETQVRNVGGDGLYEIQPTFYKNFTWMRSYGLRWELTRALSFDYSAINQSRIDEPYGRIDSQPKRDTLWDRILSGGRNTLYTQNFNASYRVPLNKIPILDWTSLQATYGATYAYTAASILAHNLGNTVANTQTIALNGDLNFTQLYQKNRWTKAFNTPKRKGPAPPNLRDNKRGDTSPRDGRDRDMPVGRNQETGQPQGQEANPAGATQEQDTIKVEVFTLNGKVINTAGMSNKQLDSLRKVIRRADRATARAERRKKRIERRNTPPEMSDGVRFAGRFLTMVKRATVAYNENSGTILPGLMDSAVVMGVNPITGQPGLNFVYGYQPGRAWLEQKGIDGVLTRDSLFNAQFHQTFSKNLNLTLAAEPFPDFRVDLSLMSSYSRSHEELFKDTGTGYRHLSPYESGSFNVSFIGLKTMFKAGGAGSGTYQEFLTNREVISGRLGRNNPYTNSTPDPNNPNFTKGYTEYAQDVLVPSFIAAYTGRDAGSVALIDYSGQYNTRSNPFKYYFPLPNWRVNYNGLGKIDPFKKYVQNLVISHGYTANISMNSFASALFYQDAIGVGFPSFIDSVSGNYVPFFQVPNLTMTEALGPLFGVDAAFQNNLTARLEFRKNRTVTLSLIDYQVSETRSSEVVIGAGYRVRGLKLPFSVFGVTVLPNDLNIKVDIGLRDDKQFNTYLAQNLDIITRGQKVVTVAPSVDYIVSERLTLRLFVDYRKSIPYTTQSYPITTVKGGLTFRFIFGQ